MSTVFRATSRLNLISGQELLWGTFDNKRYVCLVSNDRKILKKLVPEGSRINNEKKHIEFLVENDNNYNTYSYYEYSCVLLLTDKEINDFALIIPNMFNNELAELKASLKECQEELKKIQEQEQKKDGC